jgi:hypothetical protein
MLLLAILALASAPMERPRDITVTAPDAPFAAESRVSSEELARMRGGFVLPGGLDISVGLDIQTRLNGVLLLHTVLTTDGPDAGLKVYTDGKGAPTVPPAEPTEVTTVPSAPSVVVDRSPTGTTIGPQAGSSVPVKINLVTNAPSSWLSTDGQEQVPVTANGPAIQSDAGAVTLTSNSQGQVVTLSAPGLEIQHLVGLATGIVVANTGNDRNIDTVTAINVGVPSGAVALLSNAAAVNRVALSAMLAR